MNFAVSAVMFPADQRVSRGEPRPAEVVGVAAALVAAVVLAWISEDGILQPMRRGRAGSSAMMAIVAFMFVIEQGLACHGRAPLRDRAVRAAHSIRRRLDRGARPDRVQAPS